MHIAFLFNSDDPSLGGWYGGSVLRMILKTGVLQKSPRNMRVMIGDILAYGFNEQVKTIADWIALTAAVVKSSGWSRLNEKKFRQSLGACTIYCWVFQNMDADLAGELARALSRKRSFLGAIQVDFSNPLHLVFFRNTLIERYRIFNGVSTEFFHMGENEDPDLAVQEIFTKNGFTMEYEDLGARRTIFDNYDSLDHFRRIADFARVVSNLPGGSEELASEVTMALEELHPRLFDALAACVRAYERAETTEDLAQVALSGRRFMEAMADALFPPQRELHEGRSVGKTNHKNRLWAHIKAAMTDAGKFDEISFQALGRQTDWLLEAFNAALHHHASKEKISACILALVEWTKSISDIDPKSFRRPYLAYESELAAFTNEIIGDFRGKDRTSD